MITFSDNNLVTFISVMKTAIDYLKNTEIPTLEQEYASIVIPSTSLFGLVKEFLGIDSNTTYHLEADDQYDMIKLLRDKQNEFEVISTACSNPMFSASTLNISEEDAFLVYHYALKALVV